MKKVLCFLMALSIVFLATACSQGPGEGENWKIAIITNTVSQNEEEYRSAEFVVNKYGKDRVVHELWPDNFMNEQEQMISVLTKLAADPDIKAIIINQAVPGTNPAVDKFLEVRDKDDVLIIYASPQENAPDVSARADIILQPDELAMGVAIPRQAKRQGAKTLVHYSFPRHMSIPILAARRDIMREECERLGIEFVEATAPDPTSEAGVTGAQQFILEDVPKMVEKYGKDTSFFSTNCSMQVPLIDAAFKAGAIYTQPCCPSPYHGFPSALGLDVPEDIVGGLQDVIEQTTKIIEDAGLGGRFSTWPVPAAMMSTIAGAEYAIKWIEGETNGKVDLEVLQQCMADYAGMSIELNPYVENEVTYDNYLLFLVDFLTYGDLPEQE
ncbi:MAG: DUF3798 domain-containing protein [Firmicutes bacterium]|nr:DUF3798 domain-containing protein [Bacillota bacterium]HOB34347.1 DUF3798 domain-containing protein [Bacillota bacterium]HPZ90816.1 DUF3798 domain-containing protein [Bacillota bacterium]HQE02523.1 DUF3798 domain-containing protein [Bacillota bacterium]